MTTVTLVVNGDGNSAGKEQISDADFNMVSGYKDLCVGKMDSIALKENKSDNFQLEVKNALTGVMDNEERKLEIELNHLKDLIACHLDLIQQQSEQLAIKDRLISKLKNENDTLNMRLIRMDRRVNLHLSRREDADGQSDLKESLDDGHRKRPRRQSCDSVATATSKKSITLSISKKKMDKRKRDEEKAAKLVTKDLYYTTVGEHECKWGCEPAQVKPMNQLEVPSWRLKPFPKTHTMEGTENLSDEVFDRRHSRLYLDEKRRKRWDVQRIREMRQNEKLRQRERARREGGSGQLGDFIESFWPKPQRETQLIVNKMVPVSVLGVTLPALPVRDFSYSAFREMDSKMNKFSRRLRR